MAEVDVVPVPAGRVSLSERRTEQRWSVDVAGFLMAATPVTQAWYAAVTGSRPSAATGELLPVETVSWWDAVHFCNRASDLDGLVRAYRVDDATGEVDWDRAASGWRLSTEAEWEHACRAGTEGPRYGELDEIAWYRGTSEDRVHDVAGLSPNALGLHDMLGNVWEWCWDVYDAEVYGTYRVLRGCGWSDEQWSCRASVRRRSHPTFRIDDVGFRVARSAPL